MDVSNSRNIYPHGVEFARKLLLNLPLLWSHKWPPVAWQLEKFPGRGKADGADHYMLAWLGYAEHWERFSCRELVQNWFDACVERSGGKRDGVDVVRTRVE